ncbi:MAG TPA: Uma2 family endonuclease [Blastocatellia bacterium]|nr:Uma2 family endonuclease [Blastocatellia bacterium]
MTTHIAPLLTVDDLDLMPDDGNRYELIEGEIFMSRAPGLTHQIVSTNILGHLLQYLYTNPIGLAVATPGVVFNEYNGVIPDIVFISNERRGEIASTERITGAPDIVIEIVSPGAENERRDHVVKRQLYSKFGVKEYWVVDPGSRTVEIYRLRDGVLDLAATLTGQDEITSPLLPGFICEAAVIFRI